MFPVLLREAHLKRYALKIPSVGVIAKNPTDNGFGIKTVISIIIKVVMNKGIAYFKYLLNFFCREEPAKVLFSY
jgi:hypothetical protein